MATLVNGLFGPISGKVGNMVFVSRNGRCYVRSLPRPSKKPPTSRQMEHRNRFGMVMRFATPFKDLVSKCLISHKPELSGMNILVKDILRDAIVIENGGEQIDYAKVLFSKGHIAGAYNPKVRSIGAGSLKFDWATNLQLIESSSDQLIVILHRPSVNECSYDFQTGISRCSGTGIIHVPEAFTTSETHVWIAFRCQEKKRYSNSQYLGTLFNGLNRGL